ncbi:MAG: ABC transporter ATP-binding protein [Acidimicrobiales bacterium]
MALSEQPEAHTFGGSAPSAGIDIRSLSKRFRTVKALDGVELRVPFGQVVAIMGRNGAGKSTLMRVLATTVIADEGTASVCGHDVVTDALAVRRCIGLAMGDDRSFFWRLSGRRNLDFFARLSGANRSDVRRRTEAALAMVELLDVADRRVDRYSTGMRCRLGIARALLGAPRVLLLDEPTRSLDPAASDGVRALVERFVESIDSAVLLATHDLHEAMQLASEIVVMEGGCVTARRRPPYDEADLLSCIRGIG